MSANMSDPQILGLSVAELAFAIRKGSVSATQALNAYIRRAEEVDKACNALMCYVKEAAQWAAEADEYFRRTGKVLGPLHGVPFSIKDHFALKGYPVWMGLAKLKERAKPTPVDSAIVVALRQAGAIPFCKTTMTQLGELGSGGSPAHGDTLNPWDTLRTTGGSSCGEGALVGGGGSPFGIGSDVGGSVRWPAAFCGICTLKPTARRLTFNWEDYRTILNHPGDYGVLASAGPMARRVDDLVEVLSALWTEPLFKLDPYVPPMPFNREVFEDTRPLRVGWFILEYTYPDPCPAAVRAVEMAKAALEAAGHTLVPFRPETDGVFTRADFYGCQYAMTLLDNSAGQPQAELQGNVGNYGGGPLDGERLHPDFEALLTPPPQNTKASNFTEYPKTQTPGLYQAAIASRDRLRDRYAKYWGKLNLDVVLCTACPFPATPVEETRNWHISEPSCFRAYNFLDYPAGIVTVTNVNAADLSVPYDPNTDDPYMAQAAKAAVANSLGLPISVQVVAKPWQEELCLRAMLEVQQRAPFDHTQHARLKPIPRRSPDLGARPEQIEEEALISKL